MPNYKNGKIYCIRSFKTDDIYIGSTTQPLCKRIDGHRQHYKQWIKKKHNYVSSFELIKYGDAYIELICLYPCNSKEELKKEEGKYQRDMECVNKIIAGRTNKEYYQDNKERYIEKNKQRYEEHKEHIQEWFKQYAIDNKEHLQQYRKEWYEKNKQEQSKIKKEKYNKTKLIKISCSCGSIVSKPEIKRHNRSKKHQRFISSSIE